VHFAINTIAVMKTTTAIIGAIVVIGLIAFMCAGI
jgi:hypothetical protein